MATYDIVQEGGEILFNVDVRYKEAFPGTFIGQCREFPSIIVKGKTVDDIVQQVGRQMKVYFNTYPHDEKKILEIRRRLVQENREKREEILEQGWNEIECKISIARADYDVSLQIL